MLAARIDTSPHVAEVARLCTGQRKPNSGEFGYGSDLSLSNLDEDGTISAEFDLDTLPDQPANV